MKARISPLLLILLVISAGHAQQRMNYGESPWGRIDFVWTDLSPEKCNRVPRLQNYHFRACPPVAGYQLLYSSDETNPQIIIVTPSRKRHVIYYWNLTAGNFISLEKRVSWKLARSRTGKITPLALMLEVNIKPDEFTRFQNPYTVVAKLTPREVCVVGRVPINSTSAADIAGVSTSAPNKKCVGLDDLGEKDWMGVVYGLTGKGLYEDAKSAVKKIASPGARTVAYAAIARAQAESGDQAAARTTFLLGLDEVLNEKEESIYFNAYGAEVHEATRGNDLINILAAMAAIGLDTDVNDKLKFVSKADLPQALIWIGRAQGNWRSLGDRGDREAANATFMRAVQLELMRADTTAADSNLLRIVEAQVEVGLINEAKQTVLLIKNPGVRKAAENAISSSN